MFKIFFIIDGNSIAHRAWHALNNTLSAPDGTPTSVIVGFLNMLFKVENDFFLNKNLCRVVAFDSAGHTFRHEIFNDYKSNRSPLEQNFLIQLQILQDLLHSLGYNIISKTGFEADDLIASCSKIAHDSGHEVFLLSSDKDLLQILGNGIKMLRPVKSGISKSELYDETSFLNEFKFAPQYLPDYLALVGDSSDNVKGVKNIGKITASKLLSQYNTIENIFAHFDELPKSIQKKLHNTSLDDVLKTRSITLLRDDLLDSDFLDSALNLKPDLNKALSIAQKLALSNLIKKINNSSLSQNIPQNINVNESIIIDDFKSLLSNNFTYTDINEIFDLKSAYYLLHPDKTGKDFPVIMSDIKASQNPQISLLNYATQLDNEIKSHENLYDVFKNIDLPLIPVLVNMQNHGVKLDIQKFNSLQLELQNRIFEIENIIFKKSGITINLNSPQQVSWLLFEKLSFTPVSKTKSKNSYSTDALVLEKLAKLPEGEIPALILEHRELSKMLSGFVMPLLKAASLDSDNIIHSTFDPAFTGTGRLSSRDPNLQNIPAFGEWADKIKSGLIPANPDNVFISADYSQIELRILAFMSNEEKLIDAFQQNHDIHTETASWVFGISPAFITPELRRYAKMINYGLIYGMSSFGLAERLNLNHYEAEGIIEKYFNAFPNIQNFLSEIVKTAKNVGFTQTLYGRIRPINEIPVNNSKALDRTLINSPIQGTAADIARKAMILLDNSFKNSLVLQVHDSLVCECNKNSVEDFSRDLKNIMIAACDKFNLDVNIKK